MVSGVFIVFGHGCAHSVRGAFIVFAGVFLGLGAAFCQSLSYVFSRLFLSQFPRRSFTLLALAHVIMGALALCILPFVIPQSLPNWKELAPPLLGASVCYLCGQTCLFMALRYAEPSRVSPLLGIKIVVLALVTTVFMQSNYTFLQWTAVGLSVTAALMLRQSGSRIPWDSMAWVLAACVGYAFSDINIRLLVQRFSYLPLSRAALVSACLSYLLCLFFTCPLLLFSPRPGLRMWGYAIPFALAWFTAMLFLFACFGSIGVVFGNIVQSSRGLLSVVMGSLLAKWGWHFLEVRDRKSVV